MRWFTILFFVDVLIFERCRLQRLQFYALDLIAFTSNNSNFRNLTYILFVSRSVFQLVAQLVDWALRLRCSDMHFCAFESLGDFIVDNAACLYTSHQSIAAPVAPANSPCYSPRVCVRLALCAWLFIYLLPYLADTAQLSWPLRHIAHPNDQSQLIINA